MTTLLQLIFDKYASIGIKVPNITEKVNYFYEPTEKLHKFDEVTVYLNQGNVSTLIARDVVQDIIVSLWESLYKSLHFKRELPLQIVEGKVGYCHNKDTYMLHCTADDEIKNYKEKYNCSLYNVWSSNLKIETWMYSKKGTIYLEISPTYPLFYSEDFVQDDTVFEKYLASYKPLFFVEISHDQAEEWLKKSEKIIRQVDSGYMIDEASVECDKNEQ